MAKVKFIIDLIEQGIRTAKKENEKLDLTNHMADFCESSGGYFDNDLYYDFEKSIVDSIEFGNSISYNFKEFEEYYEKSVFQFIRFKNWYSSLFENIMMSYAFIATDEDQTRSCLETIFSQSRTDFEAVIMDCSDSDKIEITVNEFRPHNIKYLKKVSDNELENEIALLSACEGIFVFPLHETDRYVDNSYPFLKGLIVDNPQAGTIFFPGVGEKKLIGEDCVWETIEPGNEKIERVSELMKKSGFGYRKALIANNKLEEYVSENDLYKGIAERLSDENESIFFCLPIYIPPKYQDTNAL